MTLAELFQSFTDLWVHFDSAEAFEHGPDYPPPSLQPFDAASGRQHGAAFRSLAAAVEDLDLESIEDEIDRTLLLNAIRVRLHRVEKERQERVNPAIWCHRLDVALAHRGGEADLLSRIPGWVDLARETLVKPPLIHLEVALSRLARARSALQSESWWQSDKEALSRANGALEVLESFLRHEIEPDPEPTAGVLGPESTEWRMHNQHLSLASSKELARRVTTRVAELDRRLAEAEAALDPDGPAPDFPDLVARVPLGDGGSEIRRRLLPPAWAKAWGAFVVSLDEEPGAQLAATGWSAPQARIGAIDLTIQLGELAPGEAVNQLARLGAGEPDSIGMVGELLIDPLSETAVTVLIDDWERVHAASAASREDFVAEVVRTGLFHPSLAAWRHGWGPFLGS